MELHPHQHTHSHAHTHPATPSNHVAHDAPTSRRDFFRILAGGALAGASVLELAYHRAAWASAAAATSQANLFNLQKVADGVFFAMAHPQVQVNCNAAIFVRSKDVVVVDAHSKPSAASSLIAQVKREVTTKPVRYVINTHFHWDHIQGIPSFAPIQNATIYSSADPAELELLLAAQMRPPYYPEIGRAHV